MNKSLKGIIFYISLYWVCVTRDLIRKLTIYKTTASIESKVSMLIKVKHVGVFGLHHLVWLNTYFAGVLNLVGSRRESAMLLHFIGHKWIRRELNIVFT